MSITTSETLQYTSTAMLHNIDTKIASLNSIRTLLSSQIQENLQMQTSLEPDSPEMKALEKKRLALAEMEKQLDLQIQQYMNKRKKYEEFQTIAQRQTHENIQRAYRRAG